MTSTKTNATSRYTTTDAIGYLAIGFPAKSVTPPVFDWYGFPYSKSYLIAHQNIGYLTDSF